MYKYLWLIFLFTRVSALSAASLSHQPSCVIAQEAPCSFVNDTVNVIGGNFCLQFHHLKVPGHVPLDLVQYYNNKSSYSSWVGTGMTLNYGFLIQGKSSAGKKHDKYDKYAAFNVELPGGSIVPCIAKSKGYGASYYHLDPEVVHDSFTNCGSGQMSARNNLKNIEMKEVIKSSKNFNYAHWSCTFPDGSLKKYRRALKKESVMTVLFEEKLNKTKIDYKYRKHSSGERKIKEIRARIKDGMNRLYFKDGNKKSYITTSNGKKASFYTYKRKSQKYIYKIESSDTPTVDLHYIHDGDKSYIDRVSWPNGRFLEVEYDKKGRVINQKAPVGKNGEKQAIWNFEYHKDNTVVTDANNGKKIFSHKDGRIRTVGEYKGENLYRTTAYYWGKKAGYSWDKKPLGDEGHLMATVTFDDQGNTAGMLQYKYDKYGNILEEVTLGNLSGKNTSYFKLSEAGTIDDSSVEKYRKYYTYSDKHLVLTQTEDSGPQIEYRYKTGTDLIWAKFTRDNDTIILREFYDYDDNGIVKEKILDDGSTDNKSCLTGVTQRHIIHIRPVCNKDGYGQGLPQDIWENYLDLSSNKVTLLKHTEFKYNKAGEVIEEIVKDANDKECFKLKYEYDHKGRLHKKTNALGQTVTYTYDENGNKHYEKFEGNKFHTIYNYDESNRCTKVTEFHYDNIQIVTESEYDFMGNKTASKDRYGSITKYEYDHCNRLSKTIFADGTSISKTYDIYDNVISETNQNGAVTTYKYTNRNAPSYIKYADGSEERFKYNVNGTLAHKWDKCGARTSYEYDVLGRIIQTSLYDTAGNQLSVSKNIYNAFHLVSTCDAMGLVTNYVYDRAGKKIEEFQDNGFNYTKTTFEYDTLGRPIASKRFYGPQKDRFISTQVQYDTLNRPILEELVDDMNISLSKIDYKYDLVGNCISKRTHIGNNNTVEVRSCYNSQRELIESIDEANCSTRIDYNHLYVNGEGLKVLQRVTTDALGSMTVESYDILGRIVSVVRKNAQSVIIASTDFVFSPTGKKLKQIEHVIVRGKIDHDYIVLMEYDLLDRLTKQVEQPGSREEKTTCYTYDSSGKILTITKPDGTVLNHNYDILGRLIILSSSDNSVSYNYDYDLHNNPIRVEDQISGHITLRSYDLWNRLTEDGIEGRFSMKYQYDALGRLQNLIAPDKSSVHYVNSARLDRVERYSASQLLEYEHCYTSYDGVGRIVESQLIHNLGPCTFVWDKKGRNTLIKTPYFTQTIPSEGFDAVGNLKAYHFTDVVGEVTVDCSYDDLYQLKEERGWQNHNFTHDSINNRLSKNTSDYAVDEHNKVLSDGVILFTYDKNGNLLKDEDNHYTYDALNRLTSVKSDNRVIEYTYDSFNRRIKKNETFLLYQGMREVGILENDRITEFRVLGLGKGAELGASIAIELAGQVYCPIHDFRGNIVCLVDTNQNIAETYRYTAFGECAVSEHKAMPQNPWRFASKRYDFETGFTYFLNRYYSPNLGRWITPDPLDFADGPNIYAYVHNNPMTKFDLYGLFMEDEDIKGGRSDLALAAFTYGVAEEIVVGTHHLLCMISAAERQAEVMETGTLEEANQAFLDAFNRTLAPLNGLADSIRKETMGRLQAGTDIVNLDHYYTAGSCAPAVIGAGSAVKTIYNSAIRFGKHSLRSAPMLAQESSAVGFKNFSQLSAESGGIKSTITNNLPEGHMWTKSSPFKDKTAVQLHDMFIKKGFRPKGTDPQNGLGSYINPMNDRQYRIDPQFLGRYPEPNHVDVSRLKTYAGSLEKKRFAYKND